MKKGAAFAATLAVLAAATAAVLLARSQHNAEPKPEPSSQPAWVTQAVASMRRMFVGNPEPKSVRYHEGRKSASVTIRFSDSAVCGYCMRPAGAEPPRGRIATTSLEPRTHRALGFSLKG
jgi:hypothetical protein